MLRLADYTWTFAEDALFVFFHLCVAVSDGTHSNKLEGFIYHLGQSPRSDDIPCMHQAIEMSCALLYLLAHIVVHLHIEDIRNEVERILIVLDFSVEASQVESISQVVLVDLAEVLVAARGYELFRHY